MTYQYICIRIQKLFPPECQILTRIAKNICLKLETDNIFVLQTIQDIINKEKNDEKIINNRHKSRHYITKRHRKTIQEFKKQHVEELKLSGYNINPNYIYSINIPDDKILMSSCYNLDGIKKSVEDLNKILICLLNLIEDVKNIISCGITIEDDKIIPDAMFPMIILTVLLKDNIIINLDYEDTTDIINDNCDYLYDRIKELKILLYIFCNYSRIKYYFDEQKVWDEIISHSYGECTYNQIKRLINQKHIELIQNNEIFMIKI